MRSRVDTLTRWFLIAFGLFVGVSAGPARASGGDGFRIEKIANATGFIQSLHAAGSWIVWTEDDGFDNEIFLYDGNTVRQLTANNLSEQSPFISGNRIVWQHDFGQDLVLWENDTFTFLFDTGNFESTYTPVLDGNVLAYTKFDGNDEEIMRWDLSIPGSQPVAITNNNARDFGPVISGSSIIFIRHDTQDWDLARWPGAAPIQTVTANAIDEVTYGASGTQIVWTDENEESWYWDWNTAAPPASLGSFESVGIEGNQLLLSDRTYGLFISPVGGTERRAVTCGRVLPATQSSGDVIWAGGGVFRAVSTVDPDPSNEVCNPRFDDDYEIRGWSNGPEWSAQDRTGNPDSGSLFLPFANTPAHTCVRTDTLGLYQASAHYRVPPGQAGTGRVAFGWTWHAEANCLGSSPGGGVSNAALGDAIGSWTPIAFTADVPAAARSIKIHAIASRSFDSSGGFTAHFDDVRVVPEPGAASSAISVLVALALAFATVRSRAARRG